MTTKLPYGFFVTIEGGEGAGKSTLAKRLAERYTSVGHSVLLVSEPGGTDYGQAAREVFLKHHDQLVPEAEVGLLLTAKAQLYRSKIVPHLKAGGVVICDRFTDTLFAYQHHGKGHDSAMMLGLLKAFGMDLMPDFTLLVDIPPEVAHGRLARRRDEGGEFSSIDAMALDFHRRVRQGFITELERRSFGESWRMVDGTQAPDELYYEAGFLISHAMDDPFCRQHAELLEEVNHG